MLVIIAALQLIIGTCFLGGYFYGTSLYFAVMYVWCKSNANSDVSLWGFKMKVRSSEN